VHVRIGTMPRSVFGIVIVLCIVAVSGWMLERVPTLAFWFYDDRDHPNSRIIDDAFAAAGKTDDKRLDVSTVNGGEWRVLCLVGGYESPVSVINAYAHTQGAQITSVSKVWSWFRVGEVPETDMALAFVAPNGRLQIYRLRARHGYQEHMRSCTTRANPLLYIPR
jgi:hypothetical protein